MTPRTALASLLEEGRRNVLNAVRNLDPGRAKQAPAAGRWSVLECLEHIIIVENRFLTWIEEGIPGDSGQAGWENAAKFYGMMTDRSMRRDAPEAVLPVGNFPDLAAAIAAFEDVRNRSVAVAQTRGQALYGIRVRHPRWGEISAAEAMHLLAGHADRHADQIRETRETLSA
jgi:hypothetical protein